MLLIHKSYYRRFLTEILCRTYPCSIWSYRIPASKSYPPAWCICGSGRTTPGIRRTFAVKATFSWPRKHMLLGVLPFPKKSARA